MDDVNAPVVTSAARPCPACGLPVAGAEESLFCNRCGVRLDGVRAGAGGRPCQVCNEHAGDVFALKRDDGSRLLVCYRCFGEGIDTGTLTEQVVRPPVAISPPPAVTSPAANAAPSVEPAAAPSSMATMAWGRDRGDLIWGFVIAFIAGPIALVVMRLVLSEARRRDKIYGGWYGWALNFVVGLIVYSLFPSLLPY